MLGFPIKKVEKLVTKIGVCLLLFMTLVGILFVFDVVCNLHIFPNERGIDVFLILCLIFCVLIALCAMIASMLNVSRVANAIESIAEQYTGKEADEDYE